MRKREGIGVSLSFFFFASVIMYMIASPTETENAGFPRLEKRMMSSIRASAVLNACVMTR